MSNVLTYINDVEVGICVKVNRLSHRNSVRRFFATVSQLGDGGFWFMIAAVILVTQGTTALPSLLVVGLTALTGVLLYKLLKNRLVRERPYILNDNIQLGTAPLDRYSFPSGHTLHAVCFSLMFVALEPRLAPLLGMFSVLVATSRVVLGLHYPSDVLVGAVIGAALAIVGISIL